MQSRHPRFGSTNFGQPEQGEVQRLRWRTLVAGSAATRTYRGAGEDADHHQHCMEATVVLEIQRVAGTAVQGFRAAAAGLGAEGDERSEPAAETAEHYGTAAGEGGSIDPEHPVAGRAGERQLSERKALAVAAAGAEVR